VPFDKRGLMKSALIGAWNASKGREQNDLVFCNESGGLPVRHAVRRIRPWYTDYSLGARQ
jgi:hypothetical protein